MPGQDPAGKLRAAVTAAAQAKTVATATVLAVQRQVNEAEARLMARQAGQTIPPREEEPSSE